MSTEGASKEHHYDTIICGGGLAGLTLARQLKLERSSIRILILEKNKFPAREAAFKVGELTVEIAGFYFREVLRLGRYFMNEQYVKCGLRYFFKEQYTEFSEYPEIGLSNFAKVDSYQIDRGKFENDLAEMNKLDGIEILDEVTVVDINLNGDSGHEVLFLDKDHREKTVKCLWVVDASGRRSIIQKKLGLRTQVESECSAVWFRVKGRFDVSDFVPQTNKEWHQRVPFRIRYYSTTHLMGPGFWIWLIPLTNNNTSLGIVIDERAQSYSELNTFEKAKEWIRKQYPVFVSRLESFELLDFLGLRYYSYSSKRIFSEDRWACTGDAAFFSDPYYSPGSNLIGFNNSVITRLITDDLTTGNVRFDRVEFYNQFMIAQNEWLIADIQSAYLHFGNSQVQSLRYLWDILGGWTIAAPLMFNMIFLDDVKFSKVRKAMNSYFALSVMVRKLFVDWSSISKGTFYFQFIDYLNIPFINKLYDQILRPGKSVEELASDYDCAIKYIEEFVQVIFQMIVEDCMPEALKCIPEPYWVNVWAISLKPEDWANDGLFMPRTARRDLSEVESQLRALYTFRPENGIAPPRNIPVHSATPAARS